MTFPHINDFHTEEPKRLARELSQLEDNISGEFAKSANGFAKAQAVATFMPLGAASIVPLQPDTQESIDTSQQSALAVLPALSPANFGKRFTVIKRQAANSVFVSCADAAVTHNGSTFPTITTVGPRVFYCDATGYYS